MRPSPLKRSFLLGRTDSIYAIGPQSEASRHVRSCRKAVRVNSRTLMQEGTHNKEDMHAVM